MGSFVDLKVDPRLVAAMAKAGFVTPRPVQEAVIPTLLEGESLLLRAPTASGKALAALVPAMNRILLDGGRGEPRILVVTATRNVAEQYRQAAQKVGATMGFGVTIAVGGTYRQSTMADLNKGPEIVVGVPGRIADMIQGGFLKTGRIGEVIFDEADELVKGGINGDLATILESLPQKRHTVCTVATCRRSNRASIAQLAPGARVVDFGDPGPARNVEQRMVNLEPHERFDRLLSILRDPTTGPAVVFVNRVGGAELLDESLRACGVGSTFIIGDHKPDTRSRRIEAFERGEVSVLVASDVLARGFDSHSVQTVVNYDVPVDYEAFVHRTGRSGRANGSVGTCFTFVTPADRDRVAHFDHLTRIAAGRMIHDQQDPDFVAIERVLMGYRPRQIAVFHAAIGRGTVLQAGLAPEVLEMVGAAALERAVTEVFCRLTPTSTVDGLKQSVSTYMSASALDELGERFGVRSIFNEADNGLRSGQMLCRLAGALCFDGSTTDVNEFIFLQFLQSLPKGDAQREVVRQPVAPVAPLFQVSNALIWEITGALGHRFSDVRWARMAIKGGASTKDIVAAHPALAIRGAAAFKVAIAEGLQKVRGLLRPDLLREELRHATELKNMWSRPTGIRIAQALCSTVERETDLPPGAIDLAFHALVGAVEQDGGPAAVHRLRKRLIPMEPVLLIRQSNI